MRKIGCLIRIGTIVHALTELVTLGNAYSVSYWIAKKLGKEDCGCYQREVWLNCLTCKEHCNE
jgi:hypothetical protein